MKNLIIKKGFFTMFRMTLQKSSDFHRNFLYYYYYYLEAYVRDKR